MELLTLTVLLAKGPAFPEQSAPGTCDVRNSQRGFVLRCNKAPVTVAAQVLSHYLSAPLRVTNEKDCVGTLTFHWYVATGFRGLGENIVDLASVTIHFMISEPSERDRSYRFLCIPEGMANR